MDEVDDELLPRQRGQGASPGLLGASRHKSQLSTSQIAESDAGGELPLTVRGDSEAREPREFARDSSDGVGEAIFSQPAFLQKKTIKNLISTFYFIIYSYFFFLFNFLSAMGKSEVFKYNKKGGNNLKCSRRYIHFLIYIHISTAIHFAYSDRYPFLSLGAKIQSAKIIILSCS